MSNLEAGLPLEVSDSAAGEAGPVFELVEARPVVLTPRTVLLEGRSAEAATVQRYLPTRGRRMVGAWCFLDLFGPDDVRGRAGMQVAPHPHCGLQTVTWLLAGDVRHRDSLGSDQVIRPGQLNLMSAGRGIAHAENSPVHHEDSLHGVQLWVALPDGSRDGDPFFSHHDDLPEWSADGVTGRVLLGELDGVRAPARVFSPIVGAQLEFAGGRPAEVPVRADWEYALLVLEGEIACDERTIPIGGMAYLGTGRRALQVAASGPATVLLLGGEPFTEELVMWWNFVGRSHAEIVAARQDWAAGARFGSVPYDGERLPAPPLPPVTLRPRGRV